MRWYIPNQKNQYMAKTFQRALLLCPGKYSLYNSLLAILSVLSEECKGYDLRGVINNYDLKIHSQIYRFPYKIRNAWEKYFLQKVNRIILSEINMYNPDFIMVYNSEFLLPETCLEIKKRAILIFFMGDSPFYTSLNNFFLPCLNNADLILSPDTFWLEQLNTIGIKNTFFFCPGIDKGSYNVLNYSNLIPSDTITDILYVGTCYVDSWGYKKALLMNQFISFNFKLYGNSMWKRWFSFFPELEEHYKESKYIPTQSLNKLYNNTKLIPVDGNPGIVFGFHFRLLEALGSGALPLIEYRRDVEEKLFKGCYAKLPLLDDYTKASSMAEYYLKNESERKGITEELRNHIEKNYNNEINAQRILELLIRKE